MVKCRKFSLKVEDNSCTLTDCEYSETCMGANKNIKTINPKETESNVVKSVCEPIVSEIDIGKNTDNLTMGDALKYSKELKEKKCDEALLNKTILPTELSKILRVNQFQIKKSPNGIDVSMYVYFNVKIELVMSKSMAIALSKALHRNNLE